MIYSVCLPAILKGWETEEALKAVRDSGLTHFEIWGVEDYGADRLACLKDQYGLTLVTHGVAHVPLVDPARRDEYVAGLKESCRTAKMLGVKKLISQVGQERAGVSRKEQHQCLVDSLKACIPVLEENDMVLMIEPLNTRTDHPGYFLSSAQEGFEIIREVNDPHVRLLYDMYHQYVTGDFSAEEIVKNLDLIAHFHLAGYPGRKEPGNDETDYPAALAKIKSAGYTGTVGLEYFPDGDPLTELKRFMEELAV